MKTNLVVLGDITYSGDLIGNIPVPNISSTPGNIIIENADGLYVPDNTIIYNSGNGIEINSNIISAKINPSNVNKITSSSDGLFVPDMNAVVSTTAGNILIKDSNGLYVPQPPAQITYTSGAGINISGTTISARLSAVPDNILTNNNGLYVQSYTSGNGIDITNAIVSAKINSSTDNLITVDSNGIYAKQYSNGDGLSLTNNVFSTKISTVSDNNIFIVPTGLYTPKYVNGLGLNLSGSTFSLKLSSTPNNTLTIDSNGLYSQSYTAGTGISITSNVVSAKVSSTANNVLSTDVNGLYVNGVETTNLVRRKNEVYYTNINVAITDTPVNLIQMLKAFTPSSGVLNNFFNTTSNKLNAYNFDQSLLFKLNLYGTWTTNSSNMSFSIDFTNTQYNNINQPRTPNVTVDTMSFNTFFSIDANGNIVTNGTPIVITANGGTFTISNVLLIAEQKVPPTMTSISVV